ncbi:MAG: copper amine oxidase N-terminal domain-containing protein [Armatimonadetes bacterium]|nr:copper amine oxidase N-terminal domain-containing protein [Armatimonadota bacterium]
MSLPFGGPPRRWRIHRPLPAFLGIAVALLLAEPPCQAARQYSVEVDGRPVSFATVGPVSVSGRVLVPLRGVLEQTGATLRWSAETKTVYASRGSTRLELPVGRPAATVNGRTVAMDVPAMMMRGTVMVPLRFVVEALNASVQESGGRIRITTRPEQPPLKSLDGPVAVATRQTARPAPQPSAPTRLATPPAEPSPAPVALRQTVDGIVEQVGVDAAPQTLTVLADGDRLSLELAPQAVVLSREGGETGTAREGRLSEVYPGDRVRVKINSTGKVTILVVEYDLVEGTVAAIAGDSLQLAGADAVTLTRGARIVRPDGTGGRRDEIRAGDTVRARLRPASREANVVYVLKAAPAATVTTPPPGPAAPVGETAATTAPPAAAAPPAPATPPGTGAAAGPDAAAPPGQPAPAAPPETRAPAATEVQAPPVEAPAPGAPAPAAPVGRDQASVPAAPKPPVAVASFTHDAAAPLRTGAALRVTLQGEPGGRATFDVGRLAAGLAMPEVAPGKYIGAYTVPDGINERVSIFGRLAGANGESPLVQAGVPVVIDSVPPGASDVAPARNGTVAEAHPVIYAVFEDPEGSGVDAAQVRLAVAGEDVTARATLTPRFIHYRPVLPIANGPVAARLSIQDRAGNRSETEWQFTVDAPEVPITSVAHNAARPLDVGQSVTVTVAGKPRGAASFDIGTMKVGIPLSETSPGIYQGRYTAEKGDVALSARVVAHLITETGDRFTRECSEPITIVTVPPRAPTIASPTDGDVAERTLVVSGRAQPGVTVRVQVVRTVRKLGLWSDRDVAAAYEAMVDNEGTFTTARMAVPGRGREETVTIQAVAIDAAGHPSDVVAIKVTLR